VHLHTERGRDVLERHHGRVRLSGFNFRDHRLAQFARSGGELLLAPTAPDAQSLDIVCQRRPVWPPRKAPCHPPVKISMGPKYLYALTY